jgi:hypothetical protein
VSERVATLIPGAARVKDAVAAGFPGFLGRADAVSARLVQEVAHCGVFADRTAKCRRVGPLLGDLVARSVVFNRMKCTPVAWSGSTLIVPEAVAAFKPPESFGGRV